MTPLGQRTQLCENGITAKRGVRATGNLRSVGLVFQPAKPPLPPVPCSRLG